MKRALVLMAVLYAAAIAEDRAVADRQLTLQGPTTIVTGTDAVTIPRMLSYQGKLTDSLGNSAADTLHAIRFRLYAQPTGGTQLWEENQQVRTKSGLFSILLGSVTPIGSMPDAGAVYLGMAVAGGAELTPRLRIASAAYAYKADTANYAFASAGGGGDNAWVRGGDSVLYTAHMLGLSKGGATNALLGPSAMYHVNFGFRCTTGLEGQDRFHIAIGGGRNNVVSGSYSTVSGGISNRVTGSDATIAGGNANSVGASGGAVGGGVMNNAAGSSAVVAGGIRGLAGGDYSVVGGGRSDTAAALYGAVLSGYHNVAGATAVDTGVVVAGGYENRAAGRYASIGGGQSNYACSSSATVGGGRGNSATEEYAMVGGGRDNSASGYCAAVGGGIRNSAPGFMSVVGGGEENIAGGGLSSTVSGGFNNEASGDYAFIGGGGTNRARGHAATIPGGLHNDANGMNSFAAGVRSRANHNSCFVWGDSALVEPDSVYSTGSNQWRVRSRGGVWFFSNRAMTTGAYLAAGSNAWASACDSATKEDFREVDRKALLDKVAALRVRDYKMKDQDDGTRHIGPVAQDFHNAFDYGETETGINMADADGVALAAIQALYEQNQNQQAEIEALKAALLGR